MTREEALRHMKALPTEYDGILYRSRTEARWAVFFDQLEIKHLYEDQGFAVDGIGYLPDFLLPSQAIIAEVKPSFDADPEGVQKLRNLIAARGMERGVVLPAIESGDMHLLLMGPDGHGETWEDDRGTWLMCPDGYHFDIQPYPERGCKNCRTGNDCWYDAEEIRRPYAFARNYRFGRQ
jgi:hypothetical protein